MTHPETLAPATAATASLAPGAAPDGHPAHAAACRNCDAAMHGPFCAQCGQGAVHENPTAHELLHDATHEFLHLDGKIFTTLRLLLTRPGFLTVEHLRGRRARYITPIRLYLTCSVLYFLVAAVADPVEKAVARETGRSNVALTKRPRVILEAERVSQDSVARVLEAQGAQRGGVARVIFGHAANVQRDQLGFARQMRATIPKIFFVFVPLFAWIVYRVYRRRGHYPAHLYFALHLFAFGFVTSAIGEVLGLLPRMSFVVGYALLAVWTWYGVRALREVYGGTWTVTTARAAAIGALGFLGFVLVGIAGSAIVFLTF
jgi:hypothetical protein